MCNKLILEILEQLQTLRRDISEDVTGLLNVVDVYADQMEDELNNILADLKDSDDEEYYEGNY